MTAPPPPDRPGSPLPGPLVTADWLAGHLDEVVVADVRWYADGRPGRDAYLAGHVPGAVWVDLDADLAGPPGGTAGRHPLPTPEHLAEALGRLGIGEGAPVVAYDDAGGSVAARLWWMLDAIGQPAAVLDGGLQAWPGPLATGAEARPPVARRPTPWPAARFVDADAVAAAVAEPASGTVVLDARAAGRYADGDPRLDPRPGHVPGARSAPWAGNLDPAGRFLPAEALRERYAGVGVTPGGDRPAGRRVVAYCGSGVTACHDLLALTVAGITDTALFTGSWSAWASDPDRPTATGPSPR